MTERNDTTVINTGSSGGAVWFFVGAIVVIAIVLGYIFVGAPSGGEGVNISVETPTVQVPAAN